MLRNNWVCAKKNSQNYAISRAGRKKKRKRAFAREISIVATIRYFYTSHMSLDASWFSYRHLYFDGLVEFWASIIFLLGKMESSVFAYNIKTTQGYRSSLLLPVGCHDVSGPARFRHPSLNNFANQRASDGYFFFFFSLCFVSAESWRVSDLEFSRFVLATLHETVCMCVRISKLVKINNCLADISRRETFLCNTDRRVVQQIISRAFISLLFSPIDSQRILYYAKPQISTEYSINITEFCKLRFDMRGK